MGSWYLWILALLLFRLFFVVKWWRLRECFSLWRLFKYILLHIYLLYRSLPKRCNRFSSLNSSRCSSIWKLISWQMIETFCVYLLSLFLVWMNASSNWKNFRLWLFSIILLFDFIQNNIYSLFDHVECFNRFEIYCGWLGTLVYILYLFPFLENVSLTCNVHDKLTTQLGLWPIYENWWTHVFNCDLSIFRNLFDLICGVFSKLGVKLI